MGTIKSDISIKNKFIKRSNTISAVKRYKYLYFMFIPAFIVLVIFKFIPIYGIQIVFKNYRFADGIWGSSWVGFKHFIRMFSENTFLMVLRNTIVISMLKLFLVFPFGVIFALILNEARGKFKKITQTISYLPHFLSWVILASVFTQLLSMRGPINMIIELFGGERQLILTNGVLFIPMLILTEIWQQAGWNSIVYLAAIAAIGKELYEAAEIDGASRMQKIISITLPSLIPVISVMFLLRVGYVMNAGFDQIFNLYNPLVYDVADIIDTYVYRVGLIEMDFSYSTAIGLFKNILGVTMMLTVNFFSRKYYQNGI